MLSAIAAGNINICTFVSAAPSNVLNSVVQCSGGSTQGIIGIAQEHTNQMAGTLGTVPALAASVGQPISIRQLQDLGMQDVLLCVASGYTVEPGNSLGSDASGNGYPAALGSGVPIGAIAIEAGVAGQYIRVEPLAPYAKA